MKKVVAWLALCMMVMQLAAPLQVNAQTSTGEVLTAERSAFSPASSTFGSGTSFNTLLKVKLQASQTVDINYLQLKFEGIDSASLSGVLVTDQGGMRHGSIVPVTTGTAVVTMFDNPIRVTSTADNELVVQANFSNNGPRAGSFKVYVPKDGVRGQTPSGTAVFAQGNFPINSAQHSYVGGGQEGTGGGSLSGLGQEGTGGGSLSGLGQEGTGGGSLGGLGQEGTGGGSLSGLGQEGTGGGSLGGLGQEGTGGGSLGGLTNKAPTVTLIQATNITNNQATLLYNGVDENGDTLTYNVCRGTSTSTITTCATTANEFFTATGLSANTTYYWTVTVSDGTVNGTALNGPLSFTTLSTTPSNNLPSLTITTGVVTETTATLSWNVQDTDGTSNHIYDVCFSTDSNNVTSNCQFTTTNTSYTLTNLTPGTQYYWTVRVRDGSYIVYPDNGLLSFTTTGVTSSNAAPRVMINTPSDSDITTNSIDLNWTPLNEESGETFVYRVCISTDLGTLVSACSTETTLSTTKRLSGLNANTTYYVNVLVQDNTHPAYESAINGPLTIRTDAQTTVNNAPVVVLNNPANASVQTTNSVTLNWTGTDTDSGDQANLNYELYIRNSTNGTVYTESQLVAPANRINLPNSQALSYTYNGSNGETVSWTVRATDGKVATPVAATNGPRSFMITTGTGGNQAPSFTGTPTPANNTTFNTVSNVSFAWSATDPESTPLTYSLYITGVARGAAAPSLAVVRQAGNAVYTGSNTSYQYPAANMSDNMDYYWTVTATDGTNTVEPANVPYVFHIFTGNNTGNNAPTFGLITPTSGTELTTTANVNLQWSASDLDNDPLTYRLFVLAVARGAAAPTLATVKQGGNERTLSSNTATSYTLSVSDQMDYYWTVEASDGTVAVDQANSPLLLRINTNGSVNNGPVVTLQTPANNTVYTTVANRTLTATATDAENDPVTIRYYVRAVALSDNTTYTYADIAQPQYLSGSNTITTTDQMRYWWTADGNDGNVTTPVGAVNGPFRFDVNSNSQGTNNVPVFTSVFPTPGSVIASTNDIAMTWTATDLDNDALSYDLYITSVSRGSAAPTLANVMTTGNRVLQATTATNYTLTGVQNDRDYYWAVTVTDGVIAAPITVNNAPLRFTINTGASANNAPVVNLQSPVNNTNFITANTVTLTSTASDGDGDATTVRYYVRAVPVTDTTTYTNASLIQPQYLITGNSVVTTNQMRYIWTADVTDNNVATPVAAFNGPFNFTVNDNPQAQGLTWDLIVTNNSASNTDVPNFGLNDTIIMKINVVNSTSQAQVLNFNSTEYARVVATKVDGGATYFDSSSARSYVAGATTVTVPANTTLNIATYTWNGIGAGKVARESGNYTISASELATNATGTMTTKTVFILGQSTGGNNGGNNGSGGGGGGSIGTGGSGGGGISVDTTTPLNLPKTESDTLKIWYGPIKFEPSNGVVNFPLRHIDANSMFSANWDKGTIVTKKNGDRFLGTYFPISRYPLSRLEEPYKSKLPGGISLVDPYFTQYGNLDEKFSKPVTIRGSLEKDVNQMIGDDNDLAIIAWDMDSQTWRKIGDKSNFSGKNFSVDISESTIIAIVDTNGNFIPGGNVFPEGPGMGPDLCLLGGTDITPFVDANNHWSRQYVCQLYKLGAISGFLDGPNAGLYLPEALVTRAELLTTMMKLYGYDVANVDTDGLFPDVRKDEWFAAYIAKGRELGIIDGYDDGTFRPHRYVNRAEAMKIVLNSAKNIGRVSFDIERRAQLLDDDNYAGFTDVPESAWYSQFVSYAKRKFIISGKADNAFHADHALTRGEMAKIAYLTYIVQ